MTKIIDFFEVYIENFNMPQMSWTDGLEILIIAYVIYKIIMWLKSTRSLTLVKGIIVVLVAFIIAAILQMSTILWIANKLFTIAATVIVVVFQPELRRALERLGQKKFFTGFIEFSKPAEGLFTDKTIEEIEKACVAMAKVKTGALIVIEQHNPLHEIEKTGIEVDAMVTSQLLINIFEHNTPLHDGAVIVRRDRVAAATCYLPLSDNLTLSKDLGTRHRAGVGVSEIGDSLTIIVSEETGRISYAYMGKLHRNVDVDTLHGILKEVQNKPENEDKKRRSFIGKGARK